MADFVDITETYIIAGDYDNRKRYIMSRTGVSNPLAVCSGVTWSLGGGQVATGEPYRTYKWLLGSRGSLDFSPFLIVANDPSPQRVTDCII